MDTDSLERGRRALLRNGMFLFLISLIFSFPLPIFVNARMALSAHVIGVLESLFTVLLGLIWADLRLGAARAPTFWLRLYGAYANWLACILAAVWGSSKLAPLASVGYHAAAWQDSAVNVMFASVGIADVVAGAVIVWGLRGASPRRAD
jgi:hydroxylaminobenzene mutase